MAHFDVILRGGTIVDGTGRERFVSDVGIAHGVIARIGNLGSDTADKVIDVTDQIVAPGVIDLHTHYEAQLHWDPYLTPSGWHAMTTAVVGNCGHGLAPVRPGMAERYMRMLENTEQIEYEAMSRALSWDWETFPEFLDHLRATPKGVNIATFLPINPLLSYVMGPDEAKKRPGTPEEKARLRVLLNEAMDAGACGFGLSYLGPNGNSHVDYDGSPMPCDVMDEEDIYLLCDVLRERGEGVIQILCELPGGVVRRDVAEKMAERAQRPILHTVTMGVEGSPEVHRDQLRWLDDVAKRGLKIYSQAMTARHWQEFRLFDYNVWDIIPDFRDISCAKTAAEKVAFAKQQDRRDRIAAVYDPVEMAGQTGLSLEGCILIDPHGSQEFSKYKDWRLENIAKDLNRSLIDTLFDIMVETEMEAHFCYEESSGADPDYAAEMLRNPRVLPGTSDGGAHAKFFSGGHWSTDMILWLTKEVEYFTLEEIHRLLNAHTAEVFGFRDRGILKEGYAADIMVYDYESLHFRRKRYIVANDMPDGSWRRVTKPTGLTYILVNGVITFINGEGTGATPGLLVSNTEHDPALALAAE
jgi:N-acyl-D-aspartate/D-glutamate deacylase